MSLYNRTSHIAHRTSHIASSCPICGSKNLSSIDTVISDFVMSRITDDFVPGNNWPVKLCFCNDCTFAFYDYRMTDEEVNAYYKGYRSAEFQKQRERYDYFYTEKLNRAFNENIKTIQDQKNIIESMISRNIHRELKVGLDYGGNEGKTFTDLMGTEEKYVFDISGMPTIKGVKSISRYEDLKKYSFDFIMCNQVFEHLTYPMKMMKNFMEIGTSDTIYYIEVPSENPFTEKKGRHSIIRNLSLLFNPYIPIWRLVKSYLKMRRYPFMPMPEHINCFTAKSLSVMAERNGFSVIDIQEGFERTPLERTKVLSMLFKK